MAEIDTQVGGSNEVDLSNGWIVLHVVDPRESPSVSSFLDSYRPSDGSLFGFHWISVGLRCTPAEGSEASPTVAVNTPSATATETEAQVLSDLYSAPTQRMSKQSADMV